MASSRLRSLPSARRICKPSPLPDTAIPAESYPRSPTRRSPSMMMGTTLLLPTYPTIPHIWKPSMDSPTPISVGQGETIFLDHGVGQHFAGNSLHFGLGFFPGQPSIQSEFEILPLANAFQALIAHLFQRALNSFALGVEDAFLEGDIDVGCHKAIIILEPSTRPYGPMERRKSYVFRAAVG